MLDNILRKVRALLAQAEDPACTPAEAEAFSAKAEELIARHAIDDALARAADTTGAREVPVTESVHVAAPYVAAKAHLLHRVSSNYRCQSISHTRERDADRAGRCTLIGFRADVDAVLLLFASLQLQATSAMLEAGSGSRGFRSSFLYGFANEVGHRLAAMNRKIDTDAAPGTALVLRDRRADVADSYRQAFPNARRLRAAVNDDGGYRRGGEAGRRANLSTGSGALSGSRVALPA